MEADFWFEPRLVLEVRGAEITLSPDTHLLPSARYARTLGWPYGSRGSPARFRDDKEGREATTSQELLDMYQAQLKRVE